MGEGFPEEVVFMLTSEVSEEGPESGKEGRREGPRRCRQRGSATEVNSAQSHKASWATVQHSGKLFSRKLEGLTRRN